MFPNSKLSAFLSHILADCTASNSKDPHGAVKLARKALRQLGACYVGIPDNEAKFPSQPYIAGVTSRAKTATAEACQWLVADSGKAHWLVMPLTFYKRCMLECCSKEADPSCSASTLSNEEYASPLDAAMR